MAPGVVRGFVPRESEEGTHSGFFGFSDEAHLCFLGRAIAFLGVAGDAGADDVFPSRPAAAVARDDVVEVQFLALKPTAAVLAGVFVALEDVVPGEFDFFFGQSIKKQQHDDSGDSDAPLDRMHHVVLGVILGKIAPLTEIKRLESASFRVHHLGMA